ncbi:hypothetical protein M378DRAFT_157920, partial [Amanita muscaria Koide BX008]
MPCPTRNDFRHSLQVPGYVPTLHRFIPESGRDKRPLKMEAKKGKMNRIRSFRIGLTVRLFF